MSAATLSVVLVTPDTYARLRKTISHLARQTARHSLEIVLVSQSQLTDIIQAELVGFANLVLVETGPFPDTGRPRAAGARACTAPLIAFAEDHCFPEPGWAEHLIQVYSGPWAAVSPAMSNANPGAVSDADFLLNFGHSAWLLAEGAVQNTPWHNTSYRSEVLQGYGEQLAHMLEAEIRIHEDLNRRGLRLFLAGTMRVHHVNLSRLPAFLACQFFGGRLYGAARAEAGGWSFARKLFYTAMLPLIPLRRAPDVLRNAKRTDVKRTVAFGLACACGLMASALGEVSGYVLGQGDMGRRRITFEFERERYIRSSDLVYLRHEHIVQPAEAASA
ncbi:MAG TPA: glycosyltransferase family A protein [Bryobacteraceae bacterium]|jgi:Glycosyl transferase family 2|nr:glycosyltransferase family A protein [Bryobacteraceae bacterium]